MTVLDRLTFDACLRLEAIKQPVAPPDRQIPLAGSVEAPPCGRMSAIGWRLAPLIEREEVGQPEAMHSRRITRHLSYANVMATIGVFVALGGASYAAVALPASSVGTKQLKKSAVAAAKIKRNAISSAKVKDGSLQRGDFASGALLQGPQGVQGAKGEPGPQGDAGTPGPFPGVLPSGTTMRGAYALLDVAPNAGYLARDSVSFGLSLPKETAPMVKAHFIALGGADPNCPGTAAQPDAAPGHICVFEDVASNRTSVTINAHTYGAVMTTASVAPGDFRTTGSWAVTAP